MGIKSLLLKNISTKQTFLKNVFWLAISEGILRLSQFLLLIYTIKILGVTEFGKFTFALSFVTIFAVLAEFGLSDITTRELSQDKKIEKQYPDILSLKIILTIAVLILMLIGSFFVTSDVVIKKVIWILSFSILIGNFSYIIYAFFRARQQMEYEASAKIIQALITTGMVFFVLFHFPSVQSISLGYLLANLFVLIFLLLFFNFFIQPIRLGFDQNVFRKFFLFSRPLGLASIFIVVVLNIDSVIMGRLGQIAENGWYSATRAIINLASVLATLIWISFYPILSKLFTEAKEKFQKVWNYYMQSMIALAVPLVAGSLVLAPRIIDFIYGQKFDSSILAFQILIFASGISFIYNPYLIMLFVANKQKKYLQVYLIAAIANVATNIILIPRYSLYGASISMVITSIIIFLLGIKFSRKLVYIPFFDKKLFKTIFAVVFSSLVMLIVIKQPVVYNLNILLSISVATLSYLFVLFIFWKLLKKSDLLVNKTV